MKTDKKGSAAYPLKISGCEPRGAWHQDELIDSKPPALKRLWLWQLGKVKSLEESQSLELVKSCLVSKWVRELLFSCCVLLLLWEAGSCGWGQFGNSDEGECPPLEAITKQWQWRRDCGYYACVCVRVRACMQRQLGKSVHICPEAHWASYLMGTRANFHGGKVARVWSWPPSS
jgi:hypothetical protein